MVFQFSEISGSFRLSCFSLLIPDVSGAVLLSCSFIFWCISSISRSENQPFFIIVLTWSTSLWLVVWKLAHSYQISIILFVYPLCVWLLLKWLSASRLFSLVHILCLRLWLVWFLNSSFVYRKKEQPTFAGWRLYLPCWLSWEHRLIMTFKPVAGSHAVSYFDSTFLSWIVYCGYTRRRGCLLSVRLTHLWLRTVIVTVHEQLVTK